MHLRWKIDDVSRFLPFAQVIDEHSSGLDFLSLGRGLVLLKVSGPSLFKLQSDSFAHHADAIHGVYNCVRFLFQEIAALNSNSHSQRSISSSTKRFSLPPAYRFPIHQEFL